MNPANLLMVFSAAAAAAAGGAAAAAWRRSRDILSPAARRTPVVYSPEQFSLAFETVDFFTVDGLRLKGWFIPAAGGCSGKTVIMCHGWGVNRGDVLRDMGFLASAGYNLFLFDFRSSGESDGALSSVGYLETRDFDAAYSFLRTHRPMAAIEEP